MEVLPRKLHFNQRSGYAPLLEQQNIVWDKFNLGSDVEIYDDAGNLVAITSGHNPNLSEILANLTAGQIAPGGAR